MIIEKKWRNHKTASHFNRGREGEKEAIEFFLARGYKVIGREQVCKAFWYIDGEKKFFRVKADLILKKGGETTLVEVKTGKAASTGNRATRRQLLEYSLLYDVDHFCLFDADQEKVTSIEFPDSSETLVEKPSAKNKIIMTLIVVLLIQLVVILYLTDVI